MHILKRSILAIACILAFGGPVWGQVDASDNAALDYWKAVALMRQPRTPGDIAILAYINEQLPGMPPSVLGLEPEVTRWLLTENAMLSALAQADERGRCAFAVRMPGSPGFDLSHLPSLRALLRRSFAVAKAYEYAENYAGAAGIYVDLLEMVDNLNQDGNLTSAMAAAGMTQEIASELEGFLSREPPAEATRVLMHYFDSRQGPIIRFSDILRSEGARLGRWMLDGPGSIEERLGLLYGGDAQQYAVERLMTLPDDRKQLRLQDWVMEYEARMIRLAEAVDMPYGEAITRVRASDADKSELGTGVLPPGANPLLPVLQPTLADMYDRLLVAEAQFRMVQILTYASFYRARIGRWPVSVEELSGVLKRPMPEDPFSGEGYYYKLIQMRPRLVARVPKWVARTPSLSYTLDLNRRRLDDGAKIGEVAKAVKDHFIAEQQMQIRQAGASDDAVPLR